MTPYFSQDDTVCVDIMCNARNNEDGQQGAGR